MHTLADEMRAEMAKQRPRVTLSRLRALTGMSVSALSRRLSGEVEFTLSEADAVARALGVPLLELMTRADRQVA